MPSLLFYSANSDLKSDLENQITHHAPEFSFVDEDDAATADIVIVDEDDNKLEHLQNKYPNVPVFFLTSQPEGIPENKQPHHLIAKPFRLNSFLDELHACLNFFENSEEGYLNFNQYVVRPIKKEILNQRNNEVIKLTEKEVAIIKYLYKISDRIVTKNELLKEVWGYSPSASTHTVETHVYRLRQKVEHENPEAQLILTLDGGYQLKI